MIDEDAKKVLAKNVDQSVIEIEVGNGEPIGNLLVPLPDVPLNPDYTAYEAKILDDLDRGSVLAPFTRGEAVNTTATEITALSQYTASEIGRMARQRDLTIERLAEAYTRMLHSLLASGEAEKVNVTVEGKALVLAAETVDGSFRYTAADQSSTPISSIVKRANVVELMPVLTEAGVPGHMIIEWLVRDLDLPEEWATAAKEAAEQAAAEPAPAPELPAEPTQGVPVGGGLPAQILRNGGLGR